MTVEALSGFRESRGTVLHGGLLTSLGQAEVGALQGDGEGDPEDKGILGTWEVSIQRL